MMPFRASLVCATFPPTIVLQQFDKPWKEDLGWLHRRWCHCEVMCPSGW